MTPLADPRFTPFTIGLSPIDARDWLEIDRRRDAELAEKAELIAADRDAVFRAEPGSERAQAEAAGLIDAYLAERRAPRSEETDEPPLLAAARRVQDDLAIMARDAADDWRLAAGAICFPSSWSLAEKIGRPMDAIHARVPRFGPGARNAAVIARIFDRMSPDAVLARWNWSIYGDARLPHPRSKHDAPAARATRRRAETPHLRVERQTLRKMPETGAILFTIRIYVDPLERLAARADGQALLEALDAQLAALDADQLAYKGLTTARNAISERLRALRNDIGRRNDDPGRI